MLSASSGGGGGGDDDGHSIAVEMRNAGVAAAAASAAAEHDDEDDEDDRLDEDEEEGMESDPFSGGAYISTPLRDLLSSPKNIFVLVAVVLITVAVAVAAWKAIADSAGGGGSGTKASNGGVTVTAAEPVACVTPATPVIVPPTITPPPAAAVDPLSPLPPLDPVHDPWATCPRASALYPSDPTHTARIEAELRRLAMQDCPTVLFPLPDVVALADVYSDSIYTSDLEIDRALMAAAATASGTNSSSSSAVSAVQPLMIRPQAFPPGSRCRDVCSIPATADDRGWRGFDAYDAHVPAPQRSLWYMRDFAGTFTARDSCQWQIGVGRTSIIGNPDVPSRTMDEVACCLAVGAYVFVKTHSRNPFCGDLPKLQRPVVMMMGHDDRNSMDACGGKLFDHPMLLHAFVINMGPTGVGHPKVTPIPSSLNMIMHRYLFTFLLHRHMRVEHARATNLALADFTDAQIAALPECALLTKAESVELVRSMEYCSAQSVSCSHERTHLRTLLHLEQYVHDEEMTALRVAAFKPGFDVSSIRPFFEARRAKYGDLHLQAPTKWTHHQTTDAAVMHDEALRLPQNMKGWLEASRRTPPEKDDAMYTVEAAQAAAQKRALATLTTCRMPGWTRPAAASAASTTSTSSPVASVSSDSSSKPLFGRWSRLALINFLNGDGDRPGRVELHKKFCDGPSPNPHSDWVTCVEVVGGLWKPDNPDNAHLMPLYTMQTQYMFWMSPFGVGLDCHRTWEAMFAGSIPIVPRSSLDAMYIDGDLPLLVMDNMLDITSDFLLAHAPRFAHLERDFPRRKLLHAYWRHFTQAKRLVTVKAYLQATDAGAPYVPPTSLFGQEPLDYQTEWKRGSNKCWGSHLQNIHTEMPQTPYCTA